MRCETDGRFCFFFEKTDGRWGARFGRYWYEKDKLIPVVAGQVPKLDLKKNTILPRWIQMPRIFSGGDDGSDGAGKTCPGTNNMQGCPLATNTIFSIGNP
jgi:hypothetical protein